MKILLVEDEKRIADNIKKGLKIYSYVVDVAYDGEIGLDLACGEKYDLIILDRMLPKKSGMQIIQSLRKKDNKTPILMLTAKTQVNDRVQGLNAGADDYLGKPFAFSELLARIKALTRRRDQEIKSILKIDDLQVNTSNYEVKRGKKQIKLSKKEYVLLEFLIRHKGQVVTKEQIVEQAWSFDSDVLPNTAQVYIGYLRNKIDRPFPKKKPLIKTVRGFGYKLDVE